MPYLPLLALIFALIPPAHAMGKKIPKATVTFHTEASNTDNPKMVFPYQEQGQTRYFNRFPVAPTKEIAHYRPFPAKDGSIGAVFQLTQVGKNRLAALTTQARGRWMMSVVNGRPTNVVLIDQPVRDGIMVIWTGIKQRDIDLIDLVIPRTGAKPEQWKAHKKEVKARLKRQMKNEKQKKQKKS